ncbi:MAG: adenylosuccinate synthetase [Methanolobus sp.]
MILESRFRKVGGEVGTTTGRSRRCGWFDLPLLKKAIYLNGYTSIALTKIDVLSNLNPVKVCVAYELDGKVIDYPPEEGTAALARCKPVYEDLPGWDSDLTGVKEFRRPSSGCKDYIFYLEEKMGSTCRIYLRWSCKGTNLQEVGQIAKTAEKRILLLNSLNITIQLN